MPSKPFETVKIKILFREGRFYISSEQIPGLWLWGKDLNTLFENLNPAIQALYKHNRGFEVDVRETFFTMVSRWFLVHISKFAKHRFSEILEIHHTNGGRLTSAHG